MKRTEEELDSLVDAWHNGDGGGVSLQDFLGMSKEEYIEFCKPEFKSKPLAIVFAIKSTTSEQWLGRPFAGERKIMNNLGGAVFFDRVGPLTQILRRRYDRDGWEIKSYGVEEL